MSSAPTARSKLAWRELHWSQPVTAERATGVLRAWAADQRSPIVVLEARASAGAVRYLLGMPRSARSPVISALTGLMPDVRVTEVGADREEVAAAGRMKASTRQRPLRQDNLAQVVRAVLAALSRAGRDEELILQLVLGPRRVPLAIITHSPSALAMPWYQVAWVGNGGQLDSEKRSALRAKVADHGYACTIRIGVRAATGQRRRQLVLGVAAALRTSEAAGMTMRLVPERPTRVDQAAAPWRWPLRLNVGELTAITAWPIDADDLPGQPPAHPRPLPPPQEANQHGLVVAAATAPGVPGDLHLNVHGAQHHIEVAGLTGTGKSNLLLSLITQHLDAGRALVVVEPKGDLVDDVLARVPEHRLDDVVVLDAADAAPVGINPLNGGGNRSPEVAADMLLSVFKQLYGDALGPRSTDILHASLLTIARHPKPSLVMLGPLLTNPAFRHRLTAGINDPVFLGPFWASYERWSQPEQSAAIAPLMNKLRPLLRPSLRAVLGQPEPRFSVRQVFTERKVLLVPLRRGIIGPDAAALLGSLVVAELWQTAQARTAVAPTKRHPVMVVIDEVQDYLRLPTDLGEALAQARGLGVGFTMAHQFLGQLPLEMRAAVLSNARSRVVFQTSHSDAVEFAKGHPELRAEDFTSLGRFETYASLFAAGHTTAYASGRTYPPSEPIRDAESVKGRSRARYGVDRTAIEAGFAALLDNSPGEAGTTGRRRRTAS